jgi:hypothetical protein
MNSVLEMRAFSVLGFFVLFAFTAIAQNSSARPDLSGTWEYVERGSDFKDRVLMITQNGDEINAVETYVFRGDPFTQRTTIYADDRGEVNRRQFSIYDPPSEVTSRSSWKKDKLFRRLSYAYMMDGNGTRYQVTVDEEQIWSLSKDGKTLTINITSKRNAPNVAPIPIPTTGRSTYRRKS